MRYREPLEKDFHIRKIQNISAEKAKEIEKEAKTAKEICSFMEAEFEYVCDVISSKLFFFIQCNSSTRLLTFIAGFFWDFLKISWRI